MTKRTVSCGIVGLSMLAGGCAWAQPGDGIRWGEAVVRPYVDTAVNFDSNPGLAPGGQEQSDFFLDVTPGVNVTRTNEMLRLEALVWGRVRRYEKLTISNTDDWSETLRLGWGRQESWCLQLHERYARVTDIYIRTADAGGEGPGGPAINALGVLDRYERVEQGLLNGGGGLTGPLTDKTTLDAEYEYKRVNYLAQDLLSFNEHSSTVEVANKVTGKSSTLLVFEYDQMENNSLSNPARYYAARAGWRFQSTTKSAFQGSAGYWTITVDDPAAPDQSSRDGFAYDVRWYWQAAPNLTTSLDARNEMELAPDSPQNSQLVNRISGYVRYSPTKRLSCTLLGGYRHADYTLAVEGTGNTLVNRVVQGVHGGLRGDYLLLAWLKAYGEVWQDDVKDNVLGNYVETRVTLGLKMEY